MTDELERLRMINGEQAALLRELVELVPEHSILHREYDALRELARKAAAMTGKPAG